MKVITMECIHDATYSVVNTCAIITKLILDVYLTNRMYIILGLILINPLQFILHKNIQDALLRQLIEI